MKQTNLVLCVVLLPMILLSGCMSMVHDMTASGCYSKFSESLQKLPPVPPDQSRIVVYYPRVPIGGFPLGYAYSDIWIENPQYSFKNCDLLDQSATYLDVTPETYSVRDIGSKNKLTITTEPSKVSYVKIHSNGPVLVEEVQALSEIEKGNIRGNLRPFCVTAVPQKEYQLSGSSSPISTNGKTGNELARLFVIRSVENGNAGLPIKLGFDSKTSYPLENKRYCCILAPEGQHILTYSMKIPFHSEESFWFGCKVELKKGRDIYIGFRDGDTECNVQELTSQEAEQYLKKCKISKDGYLVLRP